MKNKEYKAIKEFVRLREIKGKEVNLIKDMKKEDVNTLCLKKENYTPDKIKQIMFKA